MIDGQLEKWVHDLNNRLGAILATAELFQMEALTTNASERLRLIESNALAACEIVKEISGCCSQ
jgi:hypothetical protein